jgi:polyhydroxyalkanoate synthesis regulator phasin
VAPTQEAKVPKLPEKIEDWTAPWEREGQEFNAETAKTLVFNLEKSNEKLKVEKSTLRAEKDAIDGELSDAKQRLAAKPGDEAAKDAEITSLRTKVAKLEKDGRPEDQALIQKYGVALDVGGLTRRDAERLVGKDVDELTEDATDLSERFAASSGNQNEQHEQTGPPQRGVQPAGQLGNGRQRQGGPPPVKSVEEMLKDTSSSGGLDLAPLGR